ncbi:MAG: hypothetical protein A2987_03100 [Omnitrophica bacterium RIFCSPLOWO2_01_FULL_45_10]|nr:MAG: hypothetical protein A2987_03100 [Omnitrophica bacterium RIFCSPLOWO2_01_FULL_45_10]
MSQDSIERNRDTDLGTVRINNDCITQIASMAAMEVKGVNSMGRGGDFQFLESLVRKTKPRGVKIQMKDNELKLTLFIIVEYGMEITKVADEVQVNAKRVVEKMTGLILSEVNVVVEAVHAHNQRRGG